MMKISIDANAAFAELEKGIYEALLTYSNVHRGSGFKSMMTTRLYEEAREIVLEYLTLSSTDWSVLFVSPVRAKLILNHVDEADYSIISNEYTGVNLGVVAIAIKKCALPKTVEHVGGGSAKLISRDWIIWAKGADKYEAGTPAIVNVIALAKALKLMQQHGPSIFKEHIPMLQSVEDILYKDNYQGISGMQLLHQIRKSIIGSNIKVPTISGEQNYINLDNSASTPTFAPVYQTFKTTLCQSKILQEKITAEVKNIAARFLNAPKDLYDVYFTPNTTEAINLLATNISKKTEANTESVVLSSIAEHSSNDLPWRKIKNHSMVRMGISADGFIDPAKLEDTLKAYNQDNLYGNKRIKFVAINGASNVLGSVNDVAEISRITHQYNAKLLVDAAQLAAHRKIDVSNCNIDFLALSGHKIYAPFGSGIMLIRKELNYFNSEEAENITQSGESNPAGIAALGKSFLLLEKIGMQNIENDEKLLTAKLLEMLNQVDGVKVYGIRSAAEANFDNKIGVVPFTLKVKMADQIAKLLSTHQGIGIRSGCHCAHVLVKSILNVSPGLEKFQKTIQTIFPKIQLPGVARISLGIENSEQDIERLRVGLHQITANKKAENGKLLKKETKVISTNVREAVY